MKETTTTTGKPLLDAESFQKLLAAAYVLQEHNDQIRVTAPTKPETLEPARKQTEAATHPADQATPSDYTQTLAKIVATQQQIHMSQLNLQEAMNLIAERTRQIARANGAGIGLLQEQKYVYRAAGGSAAVLLGSEFDVKSCLSARSLEDGESCQLANATSEFKNDLCRKYGIKALITVPVFYEGKVAGSIELHFAAANAFRDHDIRTCQLMAGLVTEAMARAAEMEWKQALAAERATMLDALDRLKPQLQRLAGEAEFTRAKSTGNGSGAGAAAAPALSEMVSCPECGNPVEAEQLFCGQCGTARPVKKNGNLQSKWASMWDLTQGSHQAVSEASGDSSEERAAWPGVGSEATDVAAQSRPESYGAVSKSAESSSALPELPSDTFSVNLTNPSQPPPDSALIAKIHPWTSALKTKAWFSWQQTGTHNALARFWKSRRADIYLSVAIILVLVAMRWIIWSKPASTVVPSSNPVVASSGSSAPRTSARRRKPPEPKLTLMEQLLVSLGLAEPPPTPTYLGNPNTQVWVDLRTALYYCPGADLYGKTPKGKFTTQKDAQLDQFEPAYRQACD